MKLSLRSSSLGPALGNGKWGSCPQEPGLRAASIALRLKESQRGREGEKEGEKEKRDMREREIERGGEREKKTEIGIMVAAPTMYRIVTMCQTLYFCLTV